ncbi:tetratricopeptide repeat protein [Melghiribacillus thermohalophilus]|uniref:Tetratricopeptide repeat protein n=1 Tax=Melghiribacillus thermohalophilus TaxID=1324956 RepID=A0A4R3NAM7_9BACI|nr:tetratricopeptide repeat protein [Melghiribacillus thermohalophilus]TCT26319.1 tetratricopeptide repeat protein [Melghiribacillus thermohalophilus]
MALGSWIKYFRSQKGLTQEELAEGICSVSYISKLENNRVMVHDEILTLLCERLDIDRGQLMTDQDFNNLKKQYEEWLHYILKKDPKASSQYFNKLHFIHPALHEETSAIDLICRFGHTLLLNQLSEAKHYVYEILNISESVPENIQYYAYTFLGIYYLNTGQLYLAKICFEEIMVSFEDIDGEVLLYHAVTLSKLHDFNKSNHLTSQALNAFQKQLNYERIIDCHMLFSINLNFLNEFDAAREHLEKILSIHQNKQSDQVLGQINHNLGLIFFRQKKYKKALYYLEKAMLYKKDLHSQLSTRYLLAKTYNKMGKYQRALDLASNSLNLSRYCNHRRYEYKFKVFCEWIRGNYEELAYTLENEIIPFFKTSGKRDEYARSLALLGEVLYSIHQYRKAAHYFYLSHQVHPDWINDRERGAQISDLSGA